MCESVKAHWRRAKMRYLTDDTNLEGHIMAEHAINFN